MSLAPATGAIAKPLERVITAFNLSNTFSIHFPNVHYNIIGRTLGPGEVLSLGETELQRPFCLVVPDYPNGLRARRIADGARMAYSGTVWVKLEKNQADAVGVDQTYEALQRYWDNLCGNFLVELDEALSANRTVLDLAGWDSFVSEISSETKAPGMGRFFRAAFRLNWGAE